MKKLKLITKELQSCPYCHGKSFRVYSGLKDRLDTDPGTYSVDQCQKCSLVFTNPLPKKNLGILYPPNYLIPSKKSRFDIFKWYRYDQYRFDYKLLHEATGLKISKIESSLDIGCGSGDRVNYLSNKGVLNSIGLDKYDNKHGEKSSSIINSEIKNYKPRKKFQIVSLFHVLEHLDNPKKQLQHISRNILNSDGYLIIQVPNYDSLERKVFKNRWFSFDVPRHLWHFNEKSLTKLLEDSGLTVTAVFKKNALLHPVTIAPSLYKSADPQRGWNKSSRSGTFGLLAWIGLTAASIPFSFFQSLMNKGSMMTLILRKT